MIITETFIFVHIPKTGGSFVEHVLRRLYSYANTSQHKILFEGEKHAAFTDVPASHRGKKLLITARNPYDHYVSFYEYGWWKAHSGDTFNESKILTVYPHYPQLSFEEYLIAINDWKLLHPDYVSPETAELFSKSNFGPLTLDYIRFIFQEPLTVIGNLSLYLDSDRYLNRIPRIRYLRTECLNTDLYEFLRENGFSNERIDFVLSLEKILPPGSSRDSEKRWPSYYNEFLKGLVRKKERFLFKLFPHYDV